MAPLLRGRLSVVRDRVTTISTPGRCIDALVTEYGVAVNPGRPDLQQALREAGLRVMEIEAQYQAAVRLAGTPAPVPRGEQEVARVVYRDGRVIDRICKTL